MIEVVGEPCLKTTADEGIAHGIPFDDGADEHHTAREEGSEAYTHFVEDDASKDKEEDKDIEEGLCSLHGAKGIRIPPALCLHQVFDG